MKCIRVMLKILLLTFYFYNTDKYTVYKRLSKNTKRTVRRLAVIVINCLATITLTLLVRTGSLLTVHFMRSPLSLPRPSSTIIRFIFIDALNLHIVRFMGNVCRCEKNKYIKTARSLSEYKNSNGK